MFFKELAGQIVTIFYMQNNSVERGKGESKIPKYFDQVGQAHFKLGQSSCLAGAELVKGCLRCNASVHHFSAVIR
jgi:hypothetical protein